MTDSKTSSRGALDVMWGEQVHLLRQFIEVRQHYEHLCEECAYILERATLSAGIEIASVTHRAKSLDSFCEKVIRKAYASPMTEITDLAGVRVVYLYHSDLSRLAAVVEKEFTVVEKVDKVSEQEADRFGYGALHYIVTLRKKDTGARYDDLKTLLCEIQVRTVLQDAWATIAHHLSYKQESRVPKVLRRKLNSLSGLFETADDQFHRLRDEQRQYRENAREALSEPTSFKSQQIDMDTLVEYLKRRFPDRGISELDLLSELTGELIECGYTSIAALDQALERASEAFEAFEREHPPPQRRFAAVGVVRISLRILDDVFLSKTRAVLPERYRKFKNLLKAEQDKSSVRGKPHR